MHGSGQLDLHRRVHLRVVLLHPVGAVLGAEGLDEWSTADGSSAAWRLRALRAVRRQAIVGVLRMFLYQLLSEPLIGSRRNLSPSSTNQRGRELRGPTSGR